MMIKKQSVSRPLTRHGMAYVLAGGRGSRLKELTDKRAKRAVCFGGKIRVIDFARSNAINSRHPTDRRFATQYKAHSLIRHLQHGWNFFRPERNESFDILPASQRASETQWYLGTADPRLQDGPANARPAQGVATEKPCSHLVRSAERGLLRQE